ncbi:MAG TPA: DUF5990 family protein [Caulobacteraceae bacterium]|jgi:hypothetical protein
MRLVRADDVPATNPEGDAYVFGLQDTKQAMIAGQRLANGWLVWDFSLTVKPGQDAERPVFNGRFASGPVHDRCVYLSWASIPRRVWINRLKLRLGEIDWPLVRAAQAADRPLVADVSGRGPRHSMQSVGWRVAEDQHSLAVVSRVG